MHFSPESLKSEGMLAVEVTENDRQQWAPPRLKVLLLILVLEVAAAGLMIIGQHKLLRNIDLFLNDHRSLLCILSLAFSVLNLHNFAWSLLRINLHWHWFVLLLFNAILLAHWTSLDRPLLRPV